MVIFSEVDLLCLCHLCGGFGSTVSQGGGHFIFFNSAIEVLCIAMISSSPSPTLEAAQAGISFHSVPNILLPKTPACSASLMMPSISVILSVTLVQVCLPSVTSKSTSA